MNAVISVDEVKSRLMLVQGEPALLDRDVAALYRIDTKVLNQAVKRNAERFPDGYILKLSDEEFRNWKSQIVTSNLSDSEKAGVRMGLRRAPYAFTERGLYMLATILKGERAVRTTLSIIETYAQVKSMVRDMAALQSLKDGSPEQAKALTQAGHKLANLIGENLTTDSTETTIELNLAVLKITHKVTRTKKRK